MAVMVAVLVTVLAEGAARAGGETVARDDAGSDARPLGRLEQESVDEALAALGLAVDPHPDGKVVGDVHVVNQEVFSRRDWRFQLFNIFHRTTRPGVVQREVLLKPGDHYDQSLVDETIRNLQSPPSLTLVGLIFVPPDLSSVVAIVAVASPRPGTVDLLVVTRDVWSLRFNTNFEFQQNTLSFLATSLSENNLFGWRKYLAANFILDQGRMAFGPTYYDPNIHGTHLTLLASGLAYYTRGTGDYEGNLERLSLRYPLYSLASRWGAGVDVYHQDTVVRNFLGNSVRLEDLRGTPEQDALPYQYRRRIISVDSSVVRSFGAAVIQRVTVGHLVDQRRSLVLPDFPDPAKAQLFLDELTPVSERRSEPYLRYDVFTARYAVYRDLDTFDLRENRRVGPSLSLRIYQGLPALGADFRALGGNGTAAWAVASDGGFAEAQVSVAARLRDGRLIDQSFQAKIFAATPITGRALRLILAGEADSVRNDTARTLFFLGGATGLRGYAIGALQGTSTLVGHVELRSVPLRVWSQRLGGLLFYDVGGADSSFDTVALYHDFGGGVRWLIPQFNPSVLRLDWAFATQSAPLTRAGWPGRITAGYLQVF